MAPDRKTTDKPSLQGYFMLIFRQVSSAREATSESARQFAREWSTAPNTIGVVLPVRRDEREVATEVWFGGRRYTLADSGQESARED